MDENRKKQLADKLTAKGAVLPCPRCSRKEFAILDGYAMHGVQEQPGGDVILGGTSIPTIVVACANCGFLSFHALGAIEPLAKPEKRQ